MLGRADINSDQTNMTRYLLNGTIEEKVIFAFLKGKKPIICSRLDYRTRAEWKGRWDINEFEDRAA